MNTQSEEKVRARDVPRTKSVPQFEDTSTDCAICLEPLYSQTKEISHNSHVEDVIQLKCGHKWHLHCIQEQLQHARPNFTKRLIFSGCRCSKCGVYCDHELLQNQDIVATMELRKKVDGLILEQLRIDSIELSKKLPQCNTEAFNSIDHVTSSSLLDEGRRMYAFYLCSCCKEPYFGGSVECADLNNEGDLSTEEHRTCPMCCPLIPTQESPCQSPAEHRAYHVWKCRYCCKPSTFLCYGATHFCTSCHERNSERVRLNRPISSLRPIPCPGGNQCHFPKLDNSSNKHMNGGTAACEQVYWCVVCNSRKHNNNNNNTDMTGISIPNGSRNLLFNPNGEHGLRGWDKLSRDSWIIDVFDNRSVLPPRYVNDDGSNNHSGFTSCFTSSFQWCVMKQTVRLNKSIRSNETVKVEVAAYYLGRTDCPSVFALEGFVHENNSNHVLQRKTTGVLNAPVDAWERVSLQFDNILPRIQSVTIVIHGKDSNFWAGYYGSKVTACSIRILGTEEELRAISFLPISQDPQQIHHHTTNRRAEERLRQRRHQQPQSTRNNHQQQRRSETILQPSPLQQTNQNHDDNRPIPDFKLILNISLLMVLFVIIWSIKDD